MIVWQAETQKLTIEGLFVVVTEGYLNVPVNFLQVNYSATPYKVTADDTQDYGYV